jgi:hypothetical protein
VHPSLGHEKSFQFRRVTKKVSFFFKLWFADPPAQQMGELRKTMAPFAKNR